MFCQFSSSASFYSVYFVYLFLLFFVLLLPLLLLLLLLLLLPLQCINGYIRVKLGYKPKRCKKFPHFFCQFSSSASFSSVYFVYLFLLLLLLLLRLLLLLLLFLALSLYFKVSNSVFSYVVKNFWYDPLILLRHTWIKTEKKGVVSKTIYHIRQNRVLSLEIKLEMASNPQFFLSVFILCFFLFCVFCVSFSSFFCSATTTTTITATTTTTTTTMYKWIYKS